MQQVLKFRLSPGYIYPTLRGRTEIVRMLLDLPLERGVNPSARFNAPLNYACRNGHTEIVRMLLALPLERGVNPAAHNNAALRLASERGFADICELLSTTEQSLRMMFSI